MKNFFSFGAKKNTEPKQKEEEINLSRRSFLKKTGAVAAGLAVGLSGVDKVLAGDLGREDELKVEEKNFAELIKTAEKVLEVSLAARIKFNKPNAQNYNLTTEELRQIRDEVDPYLETIKELILKSGNKPTEDAGSLSPGSINWLLAKLQPSGSQGIIFDALQEQGSYNEVCQSLPREYITEEYYSISAKDFLPTPENIFDFEIDPRLGFAKYYPSELADIKEKINEQPGWANPNKIKLFKEALGNEDIRKTVTDKELSLAESYSLIKAAITLQEDQPNIELTEIIETILLAQEKFKTKKILHPGTEYFIHANNNEETTTGNPFAVEKTKEARFSGDNLDELAKTCGVADKNIHRVDGTDTNSNVKTMESIQHSHGETTIYLNGHGSPEAIEIAQDGDLLTCEGVAASLIQRIKQVKDPDSLSQVTILIDACYGYDFAINLFSALEKEYKKLKEEDESLENDFAQITLPTVITSTQRESVGFTTAVCPVKMLKKHLPAIKDEGSLTGEFMLKRIQPSSYAFSDMTVFSGEKGSYTEIASLTNQQSA